MKKQENGPKLRGKIQSIKTNPEDNPHVEIHKQRF